MIVEKIAIGNKDEAYIESRFTDNINIIFSDDNNKGKTIIIQGLMYSLGYDSIFPSTFNFKEQYFYSKININNRNIEFLRKQNQFLIKEKEEVFIFDSVTDFKYHFNSNIFPLPYIVKDKRRRMVDLTLFYELFFIGQDGRNPSNLISKGQFNKKDFKNMVFSYAGFGSVEDEQSLGTIKESIRKLKDAQKILRKKLTIKSNKTIAEFTSKSYDNEVYQKKQKKIIEINNNISDLSKIRNREENRKNKLITLVSELTSLNRKLETGKVVCNDCGSDKIIYTNNDLKFDVSNINIRNHIIESIKNNIIQKEELIFEHTQNINFYQDLLVKELETTPPDFQAIVVYQDEILNNKDFDNELHENIINIQYLEEKINTLSSNKINNSDEQKNLLNQILDKMEYYYHEINPNGNLIFDDLFSSSNLTFSGSEGQEYYFSKILALNVILEHPFPLIIDSFRDGELSTDKENKMLDFYKKLNKQIILTSTLKKEESDLNKYSKDKSLNSLNYSSHNDSKILTQDFSLEFKNILGMFEGLIIE